MHRLCLSNRLDLDFPLLRLSLNFPSDRFVRLIPLSRSDLAYRLHLLIRNYLSDQFGLLFLLIPLNLLVPDLRLILLNLMILSDQFVRLFPLSR